MIAVDRSRFPVRNFADAMAQFELVWRAIDVISASLPTGIIVPFLGAGDKIPSGWLACDGNDSLGVAQYPALGALLGARYGGDGSTTFAVPDLRNKYLVGYESVAADTNRLGAASTFSADTNADGTTQTVERFFVNWIIKT